MPFGGLQRLQQAGIAQGQHRPGFFNDLAQLFGTQHRHGRHGNQSGLDHAQPSQRHANRVTAPEQDAVAWHQFKVFDQHLRNPFDVVRCLGIAEGDPVRAQQRPGPVPVLQRLGKQRVHQISLGRNPHFRQWVDQLRQGIWRGQTIMREAISLRRSCP